MCCSDVMADIYDHYCHSGVVRSKCYQRFVHRVSNKLSSWYTVLRSLPLLAASLGTWKKSLRRDSVLVSILSTWHKLKSFGKMQTSTKEVPSSEWPKGKSAGYLLGWCQLWAGGPRRCKEGNWMRSWEHTSAQHSSWVLLQLLPLGCCLEFLLWLLSMMDCDLEV